VVVEVVEDGVVAVVEEESTKDEEAIEIEISGSNRNGLRPRRSRWHRNNPWKESRLQRRILLF